MLPLSVMCPVMITPSSLLNIIPSTNWLWVLSSDRTLHSSTPSSNEKNGSYVSLTYLKYTKRILKKHTLSYVKERMTKCALTESIMIFMKLKLNMLINCYTFYTFAFLEGTLENRNYFLSLLMKLSRYVHRK